jgi:hypothetical protein
MSQRRVVAAALTGLVCIALASSARAEGTQFSNDQICKAALAAIIGRDPDSVKVDKQQDNIVYLHYIKQNDQSRVDYRCKLKGTTVVWAKGDEPWHEDPADGETKFKVAGGKLVFDQKFADGSTSKQSYSAGEIGQ